MSVSAEPPFDILLVTAPGLEQALADEAKRLGFTITKTIAGGVEVSGGWPEVWRANLQLRGVTRVLVRVGAFHAVHMAQLDKRARQFPWKEFLRRDVPVRIEATCRKSRIYHSGAVTQRIATAITEELGVRVSEDANLCIKARFDDDLCTISIDTSGDSLHKRGHKEAIGKAPMRETLAALFLRQCGFDGNMPVVDPMCGSGTFVIEAAEMAAGLMPGRTRHFAFEELAGFNATAWQTMKGEFERATPPPEPRFFGSDRDAGAIQMSEANAARAEVSAWTSFQARSISDLAPPAGPSGLVIINPPYGSRIGDKKPLLALHGALGQTLMTRFKGWRVGLITSEPSLAKATGLPFRKPGRAVLHGGISVQLFQCAALR